jgi:hypothetical protein
LRLPAADDDKVLLLVVIITIIIAMVLGIGDIIIVFFSLFFPIFCGSLSRKRIYFFDD